MELPIARQSYQPSVDTLVRALRRSEIVLARMVAEETILDAATAYTRPERPGVRCANFAAEIQQIGQVDPVDVLNALFDHFKEQNAVCLTLAAADATWPAGFHEPLVERGYTARTRLVYRLDKYKPSDRAAEGLQIVPARSVYGQLKTFFSRMAQREYRADDLLADHLADTLIDQLDEPRLEVFVGRIERKPVGIAGVCSLGDTGVIRPAWTDPDFRGRGIAAALVTHTLDLCTRAQFEQVIIDRSEGCSSIKFYESQGFKRVTQYVKYYR